MAKIAQLHNGTQIHFPDEMPDHEMDAAVQRHLGVGAPPAEPAAPDMDLMGAIMQAVASHSSLSQTAKGAQDKAMQDQHTLNHKTHIITSAAKVDATNGLATATTAGFQEIMGPLGALADNSEHVKDLIVAVNSLSGTIVEVGKAIIAAIHTPRESVIQRDENDVPKSVTNRRAVTSTTNTIRG